MPHKILIVDDDQDLPEIIKQALLKEGFDVTIAPDGSQALRLSKISPPDLIIADLTMPVMNGWQLTMKIRQDPNLKKIPIIVLSGMLERDAEPDQFESATAYMVKPFEITQLIAKVKELIALSSH
jgi:two-component system sensor histidine kinase/response regulator